jgi:hypothetical protein
LTIWKFGTAFAAPSWNFGTAYAATNWKFGIAFAAQADSLGLHLQQHSVYTEVCHRKGVSGNR